MTTTTSETELEILRAQRAELDSQMAEAEAAERLGQWQELQRQRSELIEERDAALGDLYQRAEDAKRVAGLARENFETLAQKSRELTWSYLHTRPQWDNRVCELDSQIREVQPPALDAFLNFLVEYNGCLFGYTTLGSPLAAKNLMPMMYTTDATGRHSVVNQDALQFTRALLASAKEDALALAVETPPGAFLEALAELREETERELERLRVGGPEPRGRKRSD